MSSLGSPNPFFIAGKKAYEVERSLRFNDDDSAYLNRTPSSTSNRRTFTISWWFKLGNLGAFRAFFGAYDNSTSGNDGYYFSCALDSNDKLTFGAWNQNWRVTNRQFRDSSAWYHCVLAVNTTQSTAADRVKIYINGVEETSFATTNNPAEDLDLGWNFNAQVHTIGRINYTSGSGPYPFDGYIAEFNSIDGSQLDPSSFAETDVLTGEYKPKKYTGGYGTNGFYLNFSDNSGTTATTLGKDSSGNGNNFTPNNFSVSAGTGNDSLEDTPTNNFCTLNPLDQKNTSIQNGNLTVTQASDPARIRGTFSMRPDTGKWYYEMQVGSGASYLFGMKSVSSKIDDNTENVNYYGQNGNKNVNNSSSSYGASYGAGDTVAILYDSDNHTVNFYKNNADQGQITGISATTEYVPHVYLDNYGTAPNVHFNFGQRAFAYTPPTGAKKLNSANLPDPTIKLPDKHFDTLLYTGNGSGQTLSGLNFSPDWLWIKSRSSTEPHELNDTVRGTLKSLSSNSSAVENTSSGRLTAFTSDGFTVGNSGNVNDNSQTFVAWNWKGGGSASSNSDGTITSSVSANTTAGFSIVSYTGNGTSGATVGHGLGVTPNLLIVKNRDYSDVWLVGSDQLGFTKQIYLNLTNALATSAEGWNNTAPTSSVFSLGNGNATNRNTDDHIAYVFSEVAGYSKFGSYEGNQSSDGPFVYTGFTPAWIMIKNADNGSNRQWCIIDATRTTINKSASAEVLFANDNQSESVANNNYGQFASKAAVDIVSNGFKVREGETSAYTQTNRPNSHIYLAFAESPFKYARAK